jgi:hypothetical protein
MPNIVRAGLYEHEMTAIKPPAGLQAATVKSENPPYMPNIVRAGLYEHEMTTIKPPAGLQAATVKSENPPLG